MKKGHLFLLILAVLAAAGTGYCLMGQTTFDQSYQGYDLEPPAAAAASFTVVREGSYPGLSDTPVSFEQGRPYRELLAALRAQKYLPLPSFPGAPDGGIAIYFMDGCTPSCIAYWDGSFLWLPGTQGSGWRRFLPLPPHLLGEKIETICNQSC